jgi:hypothetical protein
MYKKKQNKIKATIIQRENSLYYHQNYKNYNCGSILSLIDAIIKEIYYLFLIIILKIYFSLKVKDFSNQGYISLFALDILSNGGAIYYLISSLTKFYDLYSPFNQEWSYLYIWVLCSIQLVYISTSLFLFFIKFIYIKIYFIGRFRILFIILCIVTILFNFSSLNDLNHDKYSFQIQNYEIKKLANYQKYFKRHYVNLYLNKEYDVSEYELCFEMQYPKNFSELLTNESPYSYWEFEQKKDYFVGCRNVSFKDNPSIDQKFPLSFFKCDINEKNINVLPNYCITAEQRRKKYNFIYKLNIFQFILLIGCYIYGKVANYIFHNFYLCNIAMTYQKQENNEMEEDDENEGEDEEEEDDEEYEEEEDQEEEEEEVEEKNWRKYRKISKKKMKYYKKKQKNRYRKYNNNNNENNLIQDKEDEEDEDNKDNQNDTKANLEEEKNDLNSNDNIDDKNEKKDEDKNENDNKNIQKESDKNKEESTNEKNENENNDVNKEENNKDNINLKKVYKKNNFIYQLFFSGLVDRIKNKFYNILKEIDKEIKEDEKIN